MIFMYNQVPLNSIQSYKKTNLAKNQENVTILKGKQVKCTMWEGWKGKWGKHLMMSLCY